MPDLDALAANYRRAMGRWPDAPTLGRCHEALKRSFEGTSHGLVEHVKSFIECVCLTILAEFNESMPTNSPSTTDLLVAALRPLGFENTRGASKLDKVLSGFNKLTDALTDMRNDHGAVAHGRDGFLDAVTADHARAFLHAGDAILSVLLNALEGTEPDLTTTREPYERWPHLNERIDRAVSVEARVDEDGNRPVVELSVVTDVNDQPIRIRVEPSRFLYALDRDAYVEVSRTAGAAVPGGEDEDESEPVAEPAAPAVIPTMERSLAAEIIPSYGGRLASLRPALEGFLRSEGWGYGVATEGGANLIDSLLATADENTGTDWKEREDLQAGLKIALRRVLVQFGFEVEKVKGMADRLLAWMRIQAPDDASEPATTATEGGPS